MPGLDFVSACRSGLSKAAELTWSPSRRVVALLMCTPHDGHLQNVDLTTMMDYGYWGAEQHLTAAGRPNMAIQLDGIDETSIGGLYYLLQLSTAMSAELYGIDPFDQPGVEHGKHATSAQCGRPGFEDLGSRLRDYRAKPRRTC